MAQKGYAPSFEEHATVVPNAVNIGEDALNRLAAWDVNTDIASRDMGANGRTFVLPRSPGRTHTTFAPRDVSSSADSDVGKESHPDATLLDNSINGSHW